MTWMMQEILPVDWNKKRRQSYAPTGQYLSISKQR